MMLLPLKAILFWIAVTLAPPDTSQILVKGPDATWAWTKQASGWSLSADRSVYLADGNTVKAAVKSAETTRSEEVGVEQCVQGVKGHDWKNSAVLKLQPGGSLAKEGETFVYTLGDGTATAKRYVIRFRFQPAAANPKAIAASNAETDLIYEVDPASAPTGLSAADMDKLLKAVDRRLNSGAEKTARVRKLDDRRIEVAVLHGSDADTHRAERLLERRGTLEFRILAGNRQDKAVIEQARKDESNSEVLDSSGKRLAWWLPIKTGEEVLFAADADTVRRTRKQDPRDVTEILVLADPCNITGAYLTEAKADADGEYPGINFTFNDAGGQLFASLTGDHLPNAATKVRYRLGIILDGELCSAPTIQSRISKQGRITGNFTKRQAADLADILNTGSLPFRLRLAAAK